MKSRAKKLTPADVHRFEKCEAQLQGLYAEIDQLARKRPNDAVKPAVRGDLTAEQIEAARRAIPIGRLGKPEDIAETIAFSRLAARAATSPAPSSSSERRPPTAMNSDG